MADKTKSKKVATKALMDGGKGKKTTASKPPTSNEPTTADSAALYRFTQLQRQLERKDLSDKEHTNPSFFQEITGNYDRLTTEGRRKQNILKKEASKILKENPNIKTGLYSAAIDNKSTFEMYDKSGSWDIYHPKIKPKSDWMGYAKNNDYSNVKPISQTEKKKEEPVRIEKKAVQPIKKDLPSKKEAPEVKISPVKQEAPARDITPTGEVKLPTDASVKIERRGGKFAVDYFDVDEKSNLVPKTELFDTADAADSFLKARKEGGKFYGPNITRRGATESEAAKKVANKSSYGQYRKIGTGKEK